MTENLVTRLRRRTDVIWVLMNQAEIAYWPPRGRTHYLATEGLNGCTGVAITSPHAGILAHIAPLGNRNFYAIMQSVINLYNEHRQFFPTAQSLIVAAVYNRAPALPDVVETTRRALEHIGLAVRITYYDVLDHGQLRSPGQTSIVIEARGDGSMPTMYVNDRVVL